MSLIVNSDRDVRVECTRVTGGLSFTWIWRRVKGWSCALTFCFDLDPSYPQIKDSGIIVTRPLMKHQLGRPVF